MKKQNKTNLRRLLGALTALLVVAGIAVGVYWVGSLRGWFAPPPVTVETSSGQTVQIPPLSLTAKSITSKALVERGGLSFALEAGETLRAEDAVTLQGKGSLTVSNETLTLTFGDKASFLVGQRSPGHLEPRQAVRPDPGHRLFCGGQPVRPGHRWDSEPVGR